MSNANPELTAIKDKITILIDERNQANQVAKDEYSTGYADGLTMALSILDGLTD